MASNSYSLVAADFEPESSTQRPLERPIQSSVEEHELSIREHADRPGYDTEPLEQSGLRDELEPRPTRNMLSRSTIVRAIVDFTLLLPALYFLAFGFMVYSRDGTLLDGDQKNASLVGAAALGPTIFPIAFAAVTGRCLKSVAAWRLERQGATVAALEQLLGSKTVLSAITLPFSLRIFNTLTVPLLMLWALSPIGGQSSSRVISTGPTSSISFTNVSYLDTNSNFWMGGLYGGSANGTYWPTYSAAYIVSLVAPPIVKNGAQDTFAHFKIPMIEYLDVASLESGFTNITDHGKVTWSSLLGIPKVAVNGSSTNSPLPAAANSTFSVESSYWNLDCNALALRPYKNGTTPSYTDFSKPPYENVRTEKDSHGIRLGLQKHTKNSTGPRVIYWESLDGGGVT